MEHAVLSTPGGCEVAISGRFTFADHEKFRSVLAVFDEPSNKSVVLDVSSLESLDSAGLGMFMVARNTADIKNIKLRVRGAQGQVRKLLTLGKFEELLTMED